jgi:hypothetical protein
MNDQIASGWPAKIAGRIWRRSPQLNAGDTTGALAIASFVASSMGLQVEYHWTW